MEFVQLTTINLSTYGTLYGGRLGTFDNPLGYIETYLYEKSVLRLEMADYSNNGLLFYDITLKKSSDTLLAIRFDNSKVTDKYLDLTETLAAYFTAKKISQLSTTQTNFTDFSLKIEVLDEYGVSIINSTATLRAVNSFCGSKSLWLPSDLQLLYNVPAAMSVNPNGAYTYYATGITSGTTSLSFTAYKTFVDGEVVSVANTQWSITETCRIKTVSECGHIQLWWMSKEAGGWKTAAFEVVNDNIAGDSQVDFLHTFTAMQGKGSVRRMSVAYRDCTHRTAAYLSDIVTSDCVLYRYTDQYNNNYEQIVKVDGGVTYSQRMKTTIELTITIKEGEWL